MQVHHSLSLSSGFGRHQNPGEISFLGLYASLLYVHWIVTNFCLPFGAKPVVYSGFNCHLLQLDIMSIKNFVDRTCVHWAIDSMGCLPNGSVVKVFV